MRHFGRGLRGSGAAAIMTPPLVTIVIPVLNEQECISRLLPRLDAVFAGRPERLELLIVDDGSTDEPPRRLAEMVERDERVRVLTLTRNFGHQPALTAGLEHATGDAVIAMDADLQDPPEVLPEFLEQWRQGAEVVYGVRRARKEGRFKRAAYDFFYRTLAGVSSIQLPLDAGDFCLMDRRVVFRTDLDTARVNP